MHYIHTIIRSALTTAVGWDLIPRNPADRVKPPRQQAQANRHQHIHPWTREELRAFLDATHGERLFPGEALGLGWTAVDLDRGSVSIRRSLVDVARVRRARLPGIRLHDLRHTWATLALEADVHPKVVSERLGHSTVTITLTIYSHVMPAMHTDAAEGVAGFILGTPNDQGDGPPGGARVPLGDQPVTTTPT